MGKVLAQLHGYTHNDIGVGMGMGKVLAQLHGYTHNDIGVGMGMGKVLAQLHRKPSTPCCAPGVRVKVSMVRVRRI